MNSMAMMMGWWFCCNGDRSLRFPTVLEVRGLI